MSTKSPSVIKSHYIKFIVLSLVLTIAALSWASYRKDSFNNKIERDVLAPAGSVRGIRDTPRNSLSCIIGQTFVGTAQSPNGARVEHGFYFRDTYTYRPPSGVWIMTW